MSITVEATYENGVLKLEKPLPIQEKARVTVTVDLMPGQGRPRRHASHPWTGDQETLDYLAMSPDLDPQEGS